MTAVPTLEERDFAVMRALVASLEAVTITRQVFPRTTKAIADLQHLLDLEKARVDTFGAKAEYRHAKDRTLARRIAGVTLPD